MHLNNSWNCLKSSARMGGDGMMASSREEKELCSRDTFLGAGSSSGSLDIFFVVGLDLVGEH